jgi:hypothetical protein
VTLSPVLKPYLLQVKREFFRFRLYQVMQLRSSYAIRLYQWAKRWEFRKSIEITVQDLRNVLGASNLAEYADFKRRAIKPAIDEINRESDLSISFRELKRQRSKAVDRLVFSIKREKRPELEVLQPPVLASVTPSALYGRLLPEGAVDSALRAEAASFRHGRAALQIHVALSEPLSWRDPRLAEIPLIHLSDGSASTGIACAEAEAGLLPRHPTVVVGRQYLLDPARGCPRARPLCGCSCRRCRTRPVATLPANSTRRTAGLRRWLRDMPTACWTGSHGTPPICATKFARSTS